MQTLFVTTKLKRSKTKCVCVFASSKLLHRFAITCTYQPNSHRDTRLEYVIKTNKYIHSMTRPPLPRYKRRAGPRIKQNEIILLVRPVPCVKWTVYAYAVCHIYFGAPPNERTIELSSTSCPRRSICTWIWYKYKIWFPDTEEMQTDSVSLIQFCWAHVGALLIHEFVPNGRCIPVLCESAIEHVQIWGCECICYLLKWRDECGGCECIVGFDYFGNYFENCFMWELWRLLNNFDLWFGLT